MINIKIIDKKNSKKFEEFDKKTWKQFNKDRGYKWDKKKIEIAAYQDAEIVGTATFKIIGGASYLSTIITKKNTRNKGIGQMLLNKFEEISREKKCHVLYLDTSQIHKEAIKFYEKNGYLRVATIPNNKFHFDWYFYQKEII